MERIGKVIFGVILCALAGSAQAGVVAAVIGEDKSRILLYSEPGKICTGVALRAQYVGPTGRYTEGCWKAGNGMIHIAFTDGDTAQVPMDQFKKPEEI